MTKVAIIGSAACANKFIETIKKHGKQTEFMLQFIPENLPAIIDDIEIFKKKIPREIFDADVICDYSGHKDIVYALAGVKKVVSPKCFCAADISEEFGIPEFEVEIDKDNGIIKNITVTKSSPCGASYFLADKLKGLKIDEALSNVGLLTQHACRGSGGPLGTIHAAAEIHKKALKDAIGKKI
ncbi:MAG: hypothetical protein A7315_06940 [Candidatus Altiarchaeales archaeon WOR_SM1_79]|nr:MAG: hypothetical protein A7315_06940 [Candidatus Altiarchaeales archaeon WOR_SM1_79]